MSNTTMANPLPSIGSLRSIIRIVLFSAAAPLLSRIAHESSTKRHRWLMSGMSDSYAPHLRALGRKK